MIIIELSYKTDLATIDRHLAAHCDFLQSCYEKNYLFASGPMSPRVGGIIITLLNDKEQVKEIFQEDPFMKANLADYRYIQFDPVKKCEVMEILLEDVK